MADASNELMYELMKRIQHDMAGMRLDIGEIKSELISMRGTMVSMSRDIHNIYGVLGRQDDRLDRIDRRLELRELAEPPMPYAPHP